MMAACSGRSGRVEVYGRVRVAGLLVYEAWCVYMLYKSAE
jgi:hypothetical protein